MGGSLPILNSTDEIKKSTIKSEKLLSKPEIIQDKSQETTTRSDLKQTHLNPENIALELQNSYASLHEQESFLLLSIQMKKYEEMLSEIKNQQTTILEKQQGQFKSILNEYILKQQINENTIRLQQERINHQIHMMLTGNFKSKYPLTGEGDNSIQSDSNEVIEKLVSNLKQRHTEELLILEESYK